MIINLPLFIDIPRKTMPPKRYMINLNNYRNWNYIVSNNIKKAYKEKVKEQIGDHVYSFAQIGLTFVLYKGSNRKIDRSNVLSITEKFLCDALVELGMIKDDNDLYINYSEYYSGGLDKDNPRVECTIIPR